MDRHGWVDTKALIEAVCTHKKYPMTMEKLKSIVAEDEKGRYQFSPDFRKIRACQGHSIPWVEPELTPMAPPPRLYHGTTAAAYGKIRRSGAIKKMARHAVHMAADASLAWKSARRWHQTPVLIEILADKMAEDGFVFGCSLNGVWCIEEVPVRYISRVLYSLQDVSYL